MNHDDYWSSNDHWTYDDSSRGVSDSFEQFPKPYEIIDSPYDPATPSGMAHRWSETEEAPHLNQGIYGESFSFSQFLGMLVLGIIGAILGSILT